MQKEFENRKGHLLDLMEELNSSIGANEKKYFHIKTVENLVFHFDEIKTEIDKKWIYETLVEYFKVCSEYVPSIDKGTSKKLFNKYLNKLTDYYHNNLGFVLLMNRAVVYLVYFLFLCLTYYFFNLYAVIAVAILIALQIFQDFRKYRNKKVYGLFW